MSLTNGSDMTWTGYDSANELRIEIETRIDEIKNMRGELPLDDKSQLFTEQTPLKPNSPYAVSKTGGDMLVAEMASELDKVRTSGTLIRDAGMRFNAGHALNYHNVEPIASLDGMEELHIGHAIVSRAVFVGLRSAVGEMKQLIQ